MGEQLVREHVRRWAEELVDLTRKNRLLYFRHTQSASFEFLQSGTRVESGISKGWAFHLPVPRPPDEVGDALIDQPAANALVVSMVPERDAVQIERGLKNLAAKAQAEFLDAGIWILHLGLGRLNWVDVDGREASSPLLLLPVLLEPVSGATPWRLISSTDGEPALNPALAIKLERDFGITLPTLDDVEEPDITHVLKAAGDAIAGMAGWTIDDSAVLTTFKFQKEVIFRDLMDNQTEIIEHPLVRLLAEGPASAEAIELDFDAGDDATLDSRHPPEDLVFIRDADATQRQCVIAARSGRSFVMDGPPGTGKSQTITNVIAQLLSDGKTVLFVSEKTAALEVVQNRLAERSLDPFVLALHSHTTTRKAIAQELGRALTERPTARERFGPSERARLIADRSMLTEYAIAVNEVRTPLSRSLHDAIGRIAQLDQLPSTPVPSTNALTLSPADFDRLRGLAEQLGRSWGPVARGEDFVWRDLRPTDHGAGREADLRRRAEKARSALRTLETTGRAIADELRLPMPANRAATDSLVELLELLDRRQPVGAGLLSTDDLEAELANLKDLAAAKRRLVAAETDLTTQAPGWRRLDPSTAHDVADIEMQLRALGPSATVLDAANAESIQQSSAALDAAADSLSSLLGPVAVLAAAFGMTGEPTVGQVRRLAGLGALVGSATAPEASWLDPLQRASLIEARSVLADLLITYRGRRGALQEVFTERALDLDLRALHVRFTQVHSGLRKLGGAYRTDKRSLASGTVSGKVTKDVLARLDEAIEWKDLSDRLSSAEARHSATLGERYYPSRDGADLDEIERAIATADRALALASGEVDPEHLASQLAHGTTPDPRVPDATRRALEYLHSVDASFAMTTSITGVHDLEAVGVSDAEQWCRTASSAAKALVSKLALVEAAGGPSSKTAAHSLLVGRATVADLEIEVADGFAALQDKLGELGPDASGDQVDEAASWVLAVHQHFGGPVNARTAPILLRTNLTATELGDVVRTAEKAQAELVGEFTGRQRDEIEATLTRTFESAAEVLDHLAATVGDVGEWESYVQAREQLADAGWAAVVASCEEDRVDASAVADLVERTILNRWVHQVLDGDRRLEPRRSIDRDSLRSEFRRLDRELVDDTAARVINACSSRRPRSLVGQAGIINQQAQLKSRHKPVRKLLAEAGEAAQQLKPCFMMSPLSVSQFLPPGLRFDVVIFDEASQVREADAIGCLYRGDQLIVAGDPRQLPPTSFFQGGTGDEDGDDEDLLDFESILDRCKAQGLPPLPLSWHYRSRHESLITFSNYSFYDGRLHTFPGATFEATDLGVELFRVDGEYRRGGTRDNPIEAAMIVDRVVHHRRHHPTLTLGVVALSVAQQVCIEAEIERRSSDEVELRELMTDDRLDGFFVKNLENVQGDERDVILISIGYGPDEAGKLTMNFGPMSRPGGERRLNVAVTRAKRRVEVVASITSGQIVSDNPVTRHLARYLDYAARGTAALALDIDGSVGEPDSPFEEEVLQSVRRLGYDPVPQVGVAGYRIDLGVRDPSAPGSFVLGVECDGAAYHSSKVARDRDRLRQGVLEDLGWRIHRIWSTAWFSDRAAEEARLDAAITDAISNESSRQTPIQHPDPIEVTTEVADFDQPPDWAWVYEGPPVIDVPDTRAEFTDLAARATIADQILAAVTDFGPVHEDHVLTALRESWDIGRAGERIREAFRQALSSLVARNDVVIDRGFLSLPDQEVYVRVPEDELSPTRKVMFVPPAELRLAIVMLLRDAGPSDIAQIRTAWARLFGWRRVGADIELAFDIAVDELTAEGAIVGADPIRLADPDKARAS